MSSNMRLKKRCEYCRESFIAKTSVTLYCSHNCSTKAYKEKLKLVKQESVINNSLKLFRKANESIQSKEHFNVNEASILLGVSRRTIYRMIERKEINYAKVGSRTILRRADINNLFDKPLEIKGIMKEPISEFYTVREIQEKYQCTYNRLYHIVKEKSIPTTLYKAKLYLSKPHIDNYFSDMNTVFDRVDEWYTVRDINKKFKLTRDQIYIIAKRNLVPKKKIGRFIKLSKTHFDKALNIEV